MTNLYLALAAFIGTHLLMSHPLRTPLMAKLGERGFMLAYSLVSFATFAWVILAYRAAPEPGAGLPWVAGEIAWWVATVLMLLGSILFAGSLIGNPALPQPNAAALASATARGVFAITRHPMMWGFALWSVVHVIASPKPAMFALAGGMALLALLGSAGQDKKKALLMGDGWANWVSRTSFIPFGGQLSGRIGWKAAWPGRTVLLLGVALWLIASWAHPWFGQPIAGLWRWL